MGLADIVRINTFVTGREHLKGYMAVRDRLFRSPPPASTLMIVSGFARPEFVVEIEAVAARAD
jgi:enamine deaminase RidA (YjgF/YER057c/UK114 family)